MIVRSILIAAIGPFAWTVLLVLLRPAHRLVDPLYLPKLNEEEMAALQEKIRRREVVFMAVLLLLFTTASVTAAVMTL